VTEIVQFLPLPDLSIPSAYESWRIEALKLPGASRRLLAEHLIEFKTEIALLRAIQIAGVDPNNSDFAFQLSGQLMCSDDPIFRLYGRYQSTFLSSRMYQYTDNQATLTSQTTLPALLELLKAVKNLPKQSTLSLELEMRIHHLISRAYTVLEAFDSAYEYASQFAMLAPAIGLKNFTVTARGMVSWCLLMLGNATAASRIDRTLFENPDLTSYKFESAVSLAFSSFWNGDDDTLKQLLSPASISKMPEIDPSWLETAVGLKALTLQEKFEEFKHEEQPKRFLALMRSHKLLADALKISPFEPEKKEFFRSARAAALEYSNNPRVWLTITERSFHALCSLRIGDYGLAFQNLPKAFDTKEHPLWAKYFNLSTIIEYNMSVQDPEIGSEFLEAYSELKNLMKSTPELILKQVIKKLQLLLPKTLSFMGAAGGVSELITAAGQACIMNLKSRPIRVYEIEGLRPLQAAEFTESAFGIYSMPLGRLGGGQLEALTKCLYRSYGENFFWHEPVSPARLTTALLQAAQAASKERKGDLEKSFFMAAMSTVQNFGIVPQLQQTTKSSFLLALESLINKVLHEASEISDIWKLVKSPIWQ
jgi:hypothetical protein